MKPCFAEMCYWARWLLPFAHSSWSWWPSPGQVQTSLQHTAFQSPLQKGISQLLNVYYVVK